MAKKILRALFFDIDDTVYSTTEFAQTARRNAVKAMVEAGLKMDEEQCLLELNEVISEFGSNYEHHFDKLLQRLPEEVWESASPVIVVTAGMVAYHQTKFRQFSAYEDAIAVLRELGKRNLVLGIITAGLEIKQAEKIVRLGLHKLVPPANIFITDSIGISKTNPKLYIRACRKVGVKPEESMYVGDNPAVDIDVPHRIGMRTVLSRRSGKYLNAVGEANPDHVVHNFYDLLELLDAEYELSGTRHD